MSNKPKLRIVGEKKPHTRAQLIAALQDARSGNHNMAAYLDAVNKQMHLVLQLADNRLTELRAQKIVMPWAKPEIALLDRICRILTGQEEIHEQAATCHACGTTVTVLDTPPDGARTWCGECIALIHAARAAYHRATQEQKGYLLAAYGVHIDTDVQKLSRPQLEATIKMIKGD